MKRLLPFRIFQGLDESELQEIVSEGEHLKFEAGEVIVPPETSVAGLYIVLDGAAALRFVSGGSGDDDLDVFGPGEAFGQWSGTEPPPEARHCLVVAVSDVRLIRLPEPWLGEFLRRSASFSMRLAAHFADRLTHLECRVAQEQADRGSFLAGGGHGTVEADVPYQAFIDGRYYRRHEERLRQAAASGDSLLISGEPGVGKYQLSRILFRFSTTYKRVLLTANLYDPETFHNTVPGLELTGEEVLFGLGAKKERFPGMIEMSRRGTLFVMGVEQLSLATQRRLLRHIQDQKFSSAGSAGVWIPGPRILAATTREPERLVEEGRLLPELFDYFRDRHFSVPPLRDRKRELPQLAEFYARKFSAEVGKGITGLSDAAVQALLDHTWPGNDTEFAETIRRGVILTDGRVIHAEDMFPRFRLGDDAGKLNLLRRPMVERIFKSPYFPVVVQWTVAPFFLLLLAFLLLGPSDPASNIGAVYSWALGWPMMVIGSFFWARFWCTVCPMGSAGAFFKKIVSLNWPLPHFFRAHSTKIVALMAVFIMWLEMAMNLRGHPFRVGVLLAGVTGFSILFAALFERQGWCAYLCGLGGMMGLFARLSPLELRADRNVCQARCTGHQCYTGSEQRAGCPFFLLAPTISSNLECRLCGTCVKNCRHSSVALSLRKPGQELWDGDARDPALSLFVAAMFGALLCELLLPEFLAGRANRVAATTTLFLATTGGALGALALASAAGHVGRGESYLRHLIRYGQSYLPLVVAGFAAYHGYYLATLSPILAAKLAALLGAPWLVPEGLSLDPAVVHFLQRVAVTVGTAGNLLVLRQLKPPVAERANRVLAALPHIVVTLAAGWFLEHALTLHFYPG